MNVLIIGSGSREHATAWKLKQSSRVEELFVAPGNAGTDQLSTNLPIRIPNTNDKELWEQYFTEVVGASRQHKIGLVVIGPEAPLAVGLTDRLASVGITVFGPTQTAAEIEASKIWAHNFMERHGIPHPEGYPLYDFKEAEKRIKEMGLGVLKKDGLAAGKGVKPFSSIPEGLEIAREFLVDGPVLLQEMLVGREVSAHAFTDGKQVLHMPLSCDYKKVGKGDTGKNTGGIGSYSPPPWVEPELEQMTRRITVESVLDMITEGRPYKGVLYPGFMVTDDGPKVLEYNCRFGDPETQVILPRLKGDLLEIILACTKGNGDLLKVSADWDDQACVCVVLCSGGYPADYETGFSITGLDMIPEDILVFHAGTRKEKSGEILTDGGRVLSVVALGKTLEEAKWKVYEAIKRIYFHGMYYRFDIALV